MNTHVDRPPSERPRSIWKSRPPMTEFTYAEIGATGHPGDLPAGYRHVHRREHVGTGRPQFDVLAERLMSWGIQRGAGMDVTATEHRPIPGADVTSTVSIGPIRIQAPCRVVWTADEQRRVGFAYGTLQGHPQIGEEAFVADIDDSDIVWFTVIAFSRPGTWYTKLGGPVAGRL